ncbi:hypothetical protein HS125_08460 [bacterium]|nr:hypothetical protein [bacterium]
MATVNFAGCSPRPTCPRLQPQATLARWRRITGPLLPVGGRESQLDQLVEADGARPPAAGFPVEIFGERLYVELSQHRRAGERARLVQLRQLARELSLPVVASGDVRHAARRDYRRYDLLTCIRLGCTLFERRPERPLNAEACLASEAALRRRIPFPEAFENAAALAAQCDLDLLPGYIIRPRRSCPTASPPASIWPGSARRPPRC